MKNWILVALVLLLIPMKVFAADTKLISTKAISSKNKYPHGHYINKEGIYIEDKQNPQGFPPGVTVEKVVAGSNADMSGIKPGDVIYAVERVRVADAKDVFNLLDVERGAFGEEFGSGFENTGQILTLKIWRDGKELEFNLIPVLAAGKNSAQFPQQVHYINKEGAHIEDKQNPQGVPPGGTVIKVVEGSSADLSGLKTGDVIYAVDHVRIQTVKDIHDHLDPYLSPSLAGAILPLRIWRDGQQLEINLNPVK